MSRPRNNHLSVRGVDTRAITHMYIYPRNDCATSSVPGRAFHLPGIFLSLSPSPSCLSKAAIVFLSLPPSPLPAPQQQQQQQQFLNPSGRNERNFQRIQKSFGETESKPSEPRFLYVVCRAAATANVAFFSFPHPRASRDFARFRIGIVYKTQDEILVDLKAIL